MGLFRRKPRISYSGYSKEELFRKEKENIPMTYPELEALRREKTKDLTNQILRIIGLFGALFIVICAIGTFLYPYSVFNLFGKGDKFIDCWNNMKFHIGEGNEASDWWSLNQIYDISFTSAASAKMNFIALGAWAIIPICTVGLIGTIIIATYIVVYNIRDLVAVIKRFVHRTAFIAADIGMEAEKSIKTGLGIEKNEPVIKVENKTEEVKNLFDETDEVVEEAPKAEKRRKEDKDSLEEYSSEELDKLLSGETLDK